ncbi:MAG: CHAD domain-containing protein [Dehalococcoidia bacterium]
MAEPVRDQAEVEFQYDAPDLQPILDWLAVANVPGYTVVSASDKQLRDTYYDTADWRIHRGGFTCRVRVKGDDAELTLKTMADATAGLRQRREITEKFASESSRRPEEAPGACGASVRMMAGRRRPEALFTLDQHRRTFSLSNEFGLLAEIAVDETRLGDGRPTLRRVEVEVEPGALAATERFRGVLMALGNLVPASTSKFEAAMLAAELNPVPTEATLGSTTVTPAMAAADVGFAVMRKHFAVFLANEPGTRLGEDIEALHDMRVAARRLRAAMQAFSPWLPERVQRFRAELGMIAAVLGEVRDLDVFLERIDEWEKDDPEHAVALAHIGDVLRERRDAARGRMLTVLDRVRYDVFVERFAAWLRRGAPASFLAGREPVLVVAPPLLRKRYRRVQRMGDAINRSSPPDSYHSLRIEGKKLRYALEFFGPVYGAPATDFARRLTALQDVLGLHQDAYVAIDMLHDLAANYARRLGPETILAMGAVQERYRVHAAELRSEFRDVYRPLAGNWRTLRKSFLATA